MQREFAVARMGRHRGRPLRGAARRSRGATRRTARFVQQDMRELDVRAAGRSTRHVPLRLDRLRGRRRGRARDARRRSRAICPRTERSCVEFLHAPALSRHAAAAPRPADRLCRDRRRARAHLGDAARRDAQRDGRGVRAARVRRATATYERWPESQSNRFFGHPRCELLARSRRPADSSGSSRRTATGRSTTTTFHRARSWRDS